MTSIGTHAASHVFGSVNDVPFYTVMASSYDYRLVALSVAIAIFASYAALTWQVA